MEGSWLLGIRACPGCMRIPSNHWGGLWKGLGFPGNQMRPGCQGGERIHHVSGSFAGAPLGSLPALLQEEGHYLTIRESGGMSLPAGRGSGQRQRQRASERPLSRGKTASCRTSRLILDQSPYRLALCPQFPYLTAGHANTVPRWMGGLWKPVKCLLEMGSVIPGDSGLT